MGIDQQIEQAQHPPLPNGMTSRSAQRYQPQVDTHLAPPNIHQNSAMNSQQFYDQIGYSHEDQIANVHINNYMQS